MRRALTAALCASLAACGADVFEPDGGTTSRDAGAPDDAAAPPACAPSAGPPIPGSCVMCAPDGGVTFACVTICVATLTPWESCAEWQTYDGGAGPVVPCGFMGCTDGCTCLDPDAGACGCVVP